MRLWPLPLVLLAVTACPPNTDLTVAPPAPTPSRFEAKVPPPRSDGRLSETVIPHRYELRLDIDPAADDFVGEVEISVQLTEPATAIVLHGSGLQVSRAEVVVGLDSIPAKVAVRKASGAARIPEELVLMATRPIAAGDARLRLRFSAPLDEKLRGIYRVVEKQARYVFTQFEPSDARRMFPCFDDPAFKVPFDVTVTVPKGNRVFSNSPERERSESPDGKKTTFTFATTKRLPTYLLALAIGPLEVREGPREPVPLRLIAASGRTQLGGYALQTATEQLKILADYFGQPYPYRKLDLVAVPNFGPGAMENAGLINFREELLLVDDNTSAKSRRSVAATIAHELAHQWFGNLVTMKWWDDLWLNEGFATYVEAVIVDRWRPEMKAGLEMLSSVGWVMDFDALESARSVRQPVSNTYQAEEAFDGITYIKGAAVLGMLHHWLGEEVFTNGVANYLKKFEWKNADSADIFAALSDASGKKVGAVASTFLDQPGVPLVRTTLSCKPGAAASLSLSQQRYRGRVVGGSVNTDPLWRIPVCVTVMPPAPQTQEKQVCGLLVQRSMKLELPVDGCPAWVLPNAGHYGYYRYALLESELRSITKAAPQLATRDKVGFLSNLWALVQAGELNVAELFDVLASMRQQRERAVVEEIIDILHHVSDALIEEPLRPKFESLVVAQLLGHAQRLGWDAKKGEHEEDKLLRRSLLRALAVLTEDPWLIREAKKRATAYFKDPKSVDADTAAIALVVSVRQAAKDLSFTKVRELLKKADTPAERINAVRALGAFRDETLLGRSLSLILDGSIRAQDALYVMRSAVQWPDGRAVFIAWLREHLAEVAEKLSGFAVSRMVASLRQLCDPKAIDAAARAFEPVIEKIGGSKRRLREALENAELCVDVRARQAAVASNYLRKKGRF